MLTAKIRTTIIALVATGGFAVASAAPAVSHAQWLHYCVAGHCETAPNVAKTVAPPVTVNSQCEAKPEGGLSWEELPHLSWGEPHKETESKDEKEARVTQAERAAFELGCDPTGLHTT